jgi:hypothetical protein
VLDEYDRRRHLHDGTRPDMETGILDAWSQARRRGESVALMANTIDTVTASTKPPNRPVSAVVNSTPPHLNSTSTGNGCWSATRW